MPISSLGLADRKIRVTASSVRPMLGAWKIDKSVCRLCIDLVNNIYVVSIRDFPNYASSYDFHFRAVNVTGCLTTIMEPPVCSIEKQTLPSMCHLLKSKNKLAYRGPCLMNCNDDMIEASPICGINGVTYKSECEAWSGKLEIQFVGFIS